jgi:hypothetical protein
MDVNQPEPSILIPPQKPTINSVKNSKRSGNFSIYFEDGQSTVG